MSTKDSMGKSTENLDEAAGAAPTERFLDEVDTTQFGTTDEESEDETAEKSSENDSSNDPESDTSDEGSAPEDDEQEAGQ